MQNRFGEVNKATQPILITPVVRWLTAVAFAATALAPVSSLAQQTDQWRVDFAPVYFWAQELNGSMTVRNATIPVFLEFADAADHLGGAFSFHLEASKGRWGLLSDLNFIRLTSEAEFTANNRVVAGDVDLDNTVFELGGSYLMNEQARFSIIGGLRTYTLSPKLEFSSSPVSIEPVDTSKTSANVFGGFTYRPRISEKWMLVSRADIGAGEAEMTWSGMLGVEYGFKRWGGLVVGYKALGIDTGGDDDIAEYDVTHYGPIFGLNLHWGAK